MEDKFASRFILQSDPRTDTVVFKLRPTWWSRFYEYAWASSFVEPGDTVLDAACGISHPLKFFLADHCSAVYACDIDERISSPQSILLEIQADLGDEATQAIEPSYFERINFVQADISQLPYPNSIFDKIYCISVLEHLNEPTMLSALREFRRTLKDNGLVILTFDYPLINLESFRALLNDVGLRFFSSTDFNVPMNAISGYGLHCFRAVLCKG